MPHLLDPLKNIRITGINLLGVQVNLEDVLTGTDVDERIRRLSGIKRDLEAAVQAVNGLESEAVSRKAELEALRSAASQAAKDKQAIETALAVPEAALARVMSRATAKGRLRGVIEGLIIGFLTGAASSYVVWFFTKASGTGAG